MVRTVSDFIPLRCRTPYSILEGALRIEDLARRCRKWRIPAAALTDTNNMCAALEFSEALREQGVQPIMGCTLTVDLKSGDDVFSHGSREYDGTVVLLAQNGTGYKNLIRLSSAAYLDAGATALPHVRFSQLASDNDGLIALTGGGDGFINRLITDARITEAEARLEELANWFDGRLYVELQRHGLAQEKQTEPQLISFAYEMELPLVATNEPYFLDRHMHKAHDMLLAIAEGSYVMEPDRRHVSPEQYLKTPGQMAELFSDLPEAVANTVDIARRCAFASPRRDPVLPGFGNEGESEADLLVREARSGLEKRLASIDLAVPREEYLERLEFELGVIQQMGFPGYFLIVADFIQWAKTQNIPVGPGRGSGAGSVVAWALTITDLDPLRYGLLFERFLNPERISMPDFDIDFCQERRGEVIRYVQDKYGEDQVAHIITFGTLQARAVVRDVGRVLQLPFGQVDRLARLIPNNPANPVGLAQAVKMEPALQTERAHQPAVAELFDTALQLEGLYRNASTHAAGVVIGDQPLVELVPLYLDPRSDIPATQFTMKWVEKAGLVKFDFLGLKTLTIIDRALKYLSRQGIDVDIDNIPVDDEKAYKILADGFSQGVFQLESAGMRDTLRKMAPSSIEELTALISLYRPGPMKNIDSYIERKFDRSKITYPHDSLRDILRETYGIIIYQEQVMQIAQVLSGFTLGDADILRRAMGKKDKAEMAKQKSRFVDGAEANGVKGVRASQIFELVNEFAGYGFNKSHAAAYAFISYRTAYLKAHHPVEFIAASMSLDITNVDKLGLFHSEARRMGVEIMSPCVNESQADFAVRDGKILYALGAIKNVGLEAMRHLVEVREEAGSFTDLFDFARRVDACIFNKRAYENLARAGAFDALASNRAQVQAAAHVFQSIGTRASEERNSAQASLFGEESTDMAEPELPEKEPWELMEKLDYEMAAVGFYLSGHPLEGRLQVFAARKFVMGEDIDSCYKRGQRVVRMAGVLHRKQERLSQHTGKRFAYLNFSDPTSDYEVFAGEDLLGDYRACLEVGNLLELQVKLEMRDGKIGLTAQSITPLETSNPAGLSELTVYVRGTDALATLKDCMDGLKSAPSETQGRMRIVVPADDLGEAVLKLPGHYATDSKFQAALKSLPGVEKITTA